MRQQSNQRQDLLNSPEHQPRQLYVGAVLVRLRGVADGVTLAVGRAVVGGGGAARDVDGIDEAVFA